MEKKAIKFEQRNNNDMRHKETNGKIVGINLTKQVITLNVNGLSTSIRRQRYKINKWDPPTCCL